MSATIYAVPSEIGDPPEISHPYDHAKYMKAEQAFIEKLRDWCHRHTSSPKHKLIGFVWTYPMGDGKACYMVYNVRPLQLIELPIGDAWQIPDVVRRGLRLADIEKQYRFEQAWKAGAKKQQASKR